MTTTTNNNYLKANPTEENGLPPFLYEYRHRSYLIPDQARRGPVETAHQVWWCPNRQSHGVRMALQGAPNELKWRPVILIDGAWFVVQHHRWDRNKV